MPNALSTKIIKIIGDSAGVKTGVDQAAKQLDHLADKTEQTASRINAASSRARFDPAIRDTLRRNNVISSLASQRFAEEQRQAQVRSRIAFSLANQRRGEEERQRREALDFVARRSRIAFSLAEQRRQEEARARAARGPSFLGSVGGDIAGGGRAILSAGGAFAGGLAGSVLGVGFASIVSAIANTGAKVVGTGLGVVKSAAEKAIIEGIKREDAEVSFGALLGSRARGQSTVADITKLAIDTPFSSNELLDQSKLLLSYGVAANDLTKTLRRLGDVASGSGVELGRLSLAYGQVLAKGRLQGGEIRQFTEAGVGVGDFAAAFRDVTGRNVSTRQFLALSEAGEVSSKVVERAFERMTSAGGRFFNLMDDKSRSFGGRVQALRESVDVLAGKVGKSFITNTSAGQFLDRTAKQVQGLGADSKPIDQFFRDVDSTLGPALSRLLRGVGGVAGVSQPFALDFDKFDARLRIATESTIPTLLDAGRDLAASFLEISAAGIRVAAFLGREFVSLTDSLGFRGDDRKELAERLEQRKRGIFFGETREKALRERIAADDARIAERNAAIRATGGIVATDVADAFDARARALRASTPGDDFRNAARLPTDILDNVIGRKGNRVLQSFIGDAIKLFNDPAIRRAETSANVLNRANRAAFESGELPERLQRIVGVDVTRAKDLFAKIADGLKPFSEQIERIGESILPGFAKRAELLTDRLAKPADKPFDDFQKNVQAIDLLAGPIARLTGVGISDVEARRLRGELGAELIERFKLPELQPAPLVRAGTQEAEQALTRAIYEARNNAKSPEEELAAALERAKQTQDENNKRLDRLADALENPTGFPFIGLGFGQ
jgi:hypothetical protein